jgi:hypothetical protein
MPKARKIMIIRHAEKPEHSASPHGVSIDGEKDPHLLIVKGWYRAGALVCLFSPRSGKMINAQIDKPQFLYASAYRKHHDQGKRPQATIMPLAARLGIEINRDFFVGKHKALLESVLDCEGVVLISWEHHDIPLIANHILGNTHTVPQKWPDDRFDIVWVFEWIPALAAYTFSQVPQDLLAGDLRSVIT